MTQGRYKRPKPMAITTQHGATPYSAKDVRTATGTARSAATRKLTTFEDGLVFVLKACRALDPNARDCEIAERVVMVMDTGGKLAGLDRKRLAGRVRQLLGVERGATPTPTRSPRRPETLGEKD